MEGKSPTLEVREKNEGLNRIKQHMVVRSVKHRGSLSRTGAQGGVQISESGVRFRVRARATCGHEWRSELGLGKPKYVLHID